MFPLPAIVPHLDGGPANALSGSTFGSPVFQYGPFQVGGQGNSATAPLSSQPSGVLPGAGGLSLPMLLLLAGGVVLLVYMVKRHG